MFDMPSEPEVTDHVSALVSPQFSQYILTVGKVLKFCEALSKTVIQGLEVSTTLNLFFKRRALDSYPHLGQ